jgi:hypothetical protein
MTTFTSPFTGQVIQPTDVSYRSISLTANNQLLWPINGSPTNDAAARIMDVSSTSVTGAFSLLMPPANQTSVGQDALIRNTGAYSFTVKDYLGVNPIATVAPSSAVYIYITTNTTTSGTWGLIQFGVGSSNVDAAALAGYGVKAIGNTLNTSHPVTTFSSAYTALASDRASSYVWTGGAAVLGLTAATALGNDWFMLVRNQGTGTLTVTPASGLINGSASVVLQPADSCMICCSGLAFFTVGLGQAEQFNFTQLTKAVVTGSVTLTSAEASNVVQKYTGTLTGNVTVILPQTIQVYYITNQTDGTASNFTITFTTNTGGSVAIVPAGQQSTLVCDSVNLLNANTVLAGASTISLNDGTVGTPALNFASETSTGIYRATSGEFNTAILGVLRSTLSATGLAIVGTGNFTGGVAGGTFT